MGSCRTAGASLCPNQDFDISTSPLHQKIEYTELRYTAEEAEVFWGCDVGPDLFGQPERLLLISRQDPQKTSASSASSAFQGFVFDFAGCRPCKVLLSLRASIVLLVHGRPVCGIIRGSPS